MTDCTWLSLSGIHFCKKLLRQEPTDAHVLICESYPGTETDMRDYLKIPQIAS